MIDEGDCMSRDLIRIKGGSDGFKLLVDSSAELEDVLAELHRKLEEHPEFFPKGTAFQLMTADLQKSVHNGLKDTLQGMGLKVSDYVQEQAARAKKGRLPEQKEMCNKTQVDEALETGSQMSMKNNGESQQMMTVINRTVRNGEEINSLGSVMICGNVNPGAKIVAVGSIDVRGKCRGIVHAGAAGDYQAFVVADRLMPMQICIANLIARSPDNPEASEYAEKAYIKDGQIIIEPIER